MARKKTEPKMWRTRIVKHGYEQAGQLLANPENWRIHPKAQQDAMRALLGSELGWVQGVIVNLRKSEEWGRDRNVQTLLNGHMRVQVALREGEETQVPVDYVDLSPAEEKLALATFDKISQLAGTDDAIWDALIADMATPSPDIAAILTKPQRKPKGLARDVKECVCCAKGCQPGCGCWKNNHDSE